MVEWKETPQFLKFKKEFILSFNDRYKTLCDVNVNNINNNDISSILDMCHQVAGIAETYDFLSLGKICAISESFLDDFLSNQSKNSKTMLDDLISLLKDSFLLASKGIDPVEIYQDPSMKKIKDLVEAGC